MPLNLFNCLVRVRVRASARVHARVCACVRVFFTERGSSRSLTLTLTLNLPPSEIVPGGSFEIGMSLAQWACSRCNYTLPLELTLLTKQEW